VVSLSLVLIVLDSLRADHVGCYGNEWIETPSMDALAGESVVFTRAFPESLPTIPVRRALHTGRRTFPFRGYRPRRGDTVQVPGWEPIPEDQATLAEVLKEEGYRTGFVTDTYHQFKPSMNFHRGFDEWVWIRGQEFDRYRSAQPTGVDVDHFLTPRMIGTGAHRVLLQYLSNTAWRRSEEDWFAPMVFREGIRWLGENRDAERFFLLIDSFDPHEPWDPPREYREMYNPGYRGREVITPLYGEADYLSGEELREMRACYAGEVTMVDRWLGLFLEEMREIGLMEKTLIVIISDHGHPLGERGLIGKLGRGMFPELMDIPLLIRHPEKVGAGKRVDAFVYNHDVVPTALGLLGVRREMAVDGRDVWPLVTGEAEPRREYVTSAFDNYIWARDDRYAYTARCDGAEPRLYDLERDPAQSLDIARERPDVVQEMFKRVFYDAGGPITDYTRRAEWYSP